MARRCSARSQAPTSASGSARRISASCSKPGNRFHTTRTSSQPSRPHEPFSFMPPGGATEEIVRQCTTIQPCKARSIKSRRCMSFGMPPRASSSPSGQLADMVSRQTCENKRTNGRIGPCGTSEDKDNVRRAAGRISSEGGPMTENTLRVAMVGCGGISSLHGESWQRIPNAEIVACADVDEEKAQEFKQRFMPDGRWKSGWASLQSSETGQKVRLVHGG